MVKSLYSTHTIELKADRDSEITTRRYIESVNDLPLNGGGTRYVLSPKTYLFSGDGSNPFLLDKPFEIDDSAGGTIYMDAYLIYVGVGPLFDQAIGAGTILNFQGTILIGSSSTPSRTLFNLSFSGTGNKPVLLLDLVQCILWASLGTVTDFDTVVINNYSDRANVSYLTLDNIESTININTWDVQTGLAPGTHLTITGTTESPNVTIAGVSFIASLPSEHFVHFDTAIDVNASVQGGTFSDGGNTGSFFYDPTGRDQTDPQLYSYGVKGVQDSKTSIQRFGVEATFTTRTITAQNNWKVISSVTSMTTMDDERMTVDGFEIFQTTSIETVTLTVMTQLAVQTTAASTSFQFDIVQVMPEISVTPQNGIDTFNSASHGLNNGDLVWFGRSGTIPTGLADNLTVYYVVNASVNAFQISLTLAGSVIAFTTDGANVVVNQFIPYSIPTTSTLNGSFVITVIMYRLITVSTDDEFTVVVRNIDTSNDLRIKSIFNVIKN